ncbi:MAG: hypothetical protein ACLFVP_01435 [Candidatus Bathyarchaeia archaeon]
MLFDLRFKDRRPCPSPQTHNITEWATPYLVELSQRRGFRRPSCPPVPCVGNPIITGLPSARSVYTVRRLSGQ